MNGSIFLTIILLALLGLGLTTLSTQVLVDLAGDMTAMGIAAYEHGQVALRAALAVLVIVVLDRVLWSFLDLRRVWDTRYESVSKMEAAFVRGYFTFLAACVLGIMLA